MNIVAGNWHTQGFMIVELADAAQRIASIRLKFERRYRERFQQDAVRNRNIIKLFAEDLDVKRFFCAPEISRLLTDVLHLAEPVQTGPIVTHYTSGDLTGNNYGLPFHQDWPSMGTSTKGLIAWTSLTDIDHDGPGLRIIPGSHLAGLWPGDQTESGYVLQQQEIDGHLDIEIAAGHILLMSPYLVHKTRTASTTDWKLSLSCRFDDLACTQWSGRNFVSAYKTAVDRGAYLK